MDQQSRHIRMIGRVAATLCLLFVTVPAYAQLNAAPPTTPQLVAPAAGATNVAIPVTLEWTVSRETQTDIYFGTTNFPTTIIATIGANIDRYTVDMVQPGVKYYWRIRARNARDSRTSVTRSFTTATGTTPPPPEPTPDPTPTPEPTPTPPSATAVGPQSTITCPAGAIKILPGQFIQSFVNTNPNGTTFCLAAGVHTIASSITPKTGDMFIGEYGAVIDGTGWISTDTEDAAFKALNQDIDYVTIRNLVIRNLSQFGIAAYYWQSDHWTIENNEITRTKKGIEFPAYATVRFNWIHHNTSSTPNATEPSERGGGYGCQHCDGTLIEGNEISYNGPEQKIAVSVGVTFRNNYAHHNAFSGIWYDTNPAYPATGAAANGLVEGNVLEDNGGPAIDWEANIGGVIRNNTIRRSGDDAILVFRSQDTEIYGNTIEDNNFRGIEYFMDCVALVDNEDMRNVSAHDNTITFGTQPDAFMNGFSAIHCTTDQYAAYLNGSKNLKFEHNTYKVPNANTSVRAWIWGSNGLITWSQWQAIPQDATGTVIAP